MRKPLKSLHGLGLGERPSVFSSLNLVTAETAPSLFQARKSYTPKPAPHNLRASAIHRREQSETKWHKEILQYESVCSRTTLLVKSGCCTRVYSHQPRLVDHLAARDKSSKQQSFVLFGDSCFSKAE